MTVVIKFTVYDSNLLSKDTFGYDFELLTTTSSSILDRNEQITNYKEKLGREAPQFFFVFSYFFDNRSLIEPDVVGKISNCIQNCL